MEIDQRSTIMTEQTYIKAPIGQLLKLCAIHASVLLLIIVAVAITLPSMADAEDSSIEQKESFVLNVEGRNVILRNLVGEVKIIPSDSRELKIDATIVAGGKNATANLKLIRFETTETRKALEFVTEYPVNEYTSYFYRPGEGSWENSTVRYQKKKVTIRSKASRHSLDLHVNYVVHLPDKVTFTLKNEIGEISATGINANVHLDNSSGAITVDKSQGKASLDTGSGRLTATNHKGDVSLDSGSGRITVDNIVGRVHADTGSGRVSITAVTGDVDADTGSGEIIITNVVGEIVADTGSGRVEITNNNGDIEVDSGSGSVTIATLAGSALVDTGSGSINIRDWRQASRLNLDSGSGRVRVNGDFASLRKMRIDTGSGSVELIATALPSMQLDIESNSGINVDLPNMSNVLSSRGRFRATLGDGQGDGRISTGSGRVKFTYQ